MIIFAHPITHPIDHSPNQSINKSSRYLNEDFVGGEFFFVDGGGPVDGADPDETPIDHDGFHGNVNKTIVQPTCGRLLAYSSGRENVHGVTGLREGR